MAGVGGKYKAYPEYKDSGVDWFKQIPAHWKRTPVGVVAEVIDPQPDHRAPALATDGAGYPYVGIRDVNKDGSLNFDTARKVNEPAVIKQENSFTIEEGDLIYCKVGTLGLPRKIKPHGRCALSATLVLIKAKGIEPDYLLYALDSSSTNAQTDFLSTGSTRAALGIQQIRKFQLPFPSKAERLAISDFLDHETAKIDALIEEQKTLIRLLQEKRQAVISHAVTKGLNPDVPMKDSGVEWLGEVPEHWDISQLKFYTDYMQTGPFGSQLHAEDYVECGIPIINPAHIVDGNIEPDSKSTVDDITCERLSRHKLVENEIIFARRGELGRCAIVREVNEGWLCGTGSLRAGLSEKLLPEYAYLLITSDGVRAELSLESKGSTMDNLNTETLGRIRLPIPPLAEQDLIIKHEQTIGTKYRELLKQAQKQVDYLQERRTALISAVVTGKIDVRDWVAPAHPRTRDTRASLHSAARSQQKQPEATHEQTA